MIAVTGAKVVLILNLCLFTKGTDVEIFVNIDGNTTKLLSPLVEVSPRSNVTLICKILNPKPNLPAYLNWFKVPKSKFALKNDPIGQSNSALLKLTGTPVQNKGYYCCASLKYGILKNIYLHFTEDKLTENSKFDDFNRVKLRKFKRSLVEIYNSTALDELFRNQFLAVDDVEKLRNDVKQIFEDHYNELGKQNEYELDLFNYDNNHNHITHTHKQYTPTESESPFKSIFVLVGILLLVIFISFVIRCYESHKRAATTNSATSNSPQNQRNRCVHSRCNRNHLSGACREENLTTPTDWSIEHGFESRGNTNISPTDLDLPPNYSTTIINNDDKDLSDATSGFSLPPTYEEAIATTGNSHDNASSQGN